MRGMDANTGKPLSGEAHLRQSIMDILATPVGTRVMRRDYGSRLFDLVDAPQDAQLAVDVVAETVDALDQWEDRIRVSHVGVEYLAAGHVAVTLSGTRQAGGEPVRIEGIEVL